MRVSTALAFLICVGVVTAFPAHVRKYSSRNRKLGGIGKRDVPLLEEDGSLSLDSKKSDVHNVNTKAIDETIRTLNSIIDKEKPERKLATNVDINDVNNADSKDIDKTLNHLVRILDTVGDVTVRMDTYVERPTAKPLSNQGSHDTASGAILSHHVLKSPQAPKPDTASIPPPKKSKDDVVEVNTPKDDGVAGDAGEEDTLPTEIHPEEETSEEETPSREHQPPGPIKVDIPGYNSKLYGQADMHDKLSGSNVYMSSEDVEIEQREHVAAGAIKGVNVLTTAKPHGLIFYHRSSHDDASMNRFAHYEVMLLSVLVLLVIKAFIGLALYSKCQDLKQMNKLRVVGASSRTDLSKTEEGGILGMAEMVSRFAFDINEQPNVLNVFSDSSEDEKPKKTKMKKLKKMFTFKKKKKKESKDDKKDSKSKDKKKKTPPSPPKKGISLKNPFASKKSPKKDSSKKTQPPLPPKTSPPNNKNTKGPPPPSKTTKAPPPPSSKTTKAPPPPPNKTTKAPPPPPNKTTKTPPSSPRKTTKAPPPPPSKTTKAFPPPPSKTTQPPPPPQSATTKAPQPHSKTPKIPPPPRQTPQAPPPPPNAKTTKAPPPPPSQVQKAPPPPPSQVQKAPPPPPTKRSP